MDILLLDAFVPFTAALFIVGIIGVIEVCGLLIAGVGLSDLAEWLAHTDTFPETAWTNWLIVRGLPLSIAIVLFLTSFGVAGVALQAAAFTWWGGYLATPISVAVSLLAGWGSLRSGKWWAAPLFGTNTTAVSVDSFIGSKATIRSPRCTHHLPAEIRVRDNHGQVHAFMVRPAPDERDFVQGDEVVLQARIGMAEFSARKA